jgi:hypothetical protein
MESVRMLLLMFDMLAFETLNIKAMRQLAWKNAVEMHKEEAGYPALS